MPPTDNASYDKEIDRIIGALKDKGGDEMASALLAEAQAARKLVAYVPAPKLHRSDDALRAVEGRLAGTRSDHDCAKIGKALWRDLDNHAAGGTDKDEALAEYETACAWLTGVETDTNAAYMASICLMLVTRIRTGCSDRVPRGCLEVESPKQATC